LRQDRHPSFRAIFMPRFARMLRAAVVAVIFMPCAAWSIAADVPEQDVFPDAPPPPAGDDWDDPGEGEVLADLDAPPDASAFGSFAPWTSQWLPEGLLYRPYLAGEKESRLSHAYLRDPDRGWVSESTLGGKLGLLRYGTTDGLRPQGWQFDVEGAGLVRLDAEEESDVEAVDFRGGGYLSYRDGPLACKLGYYHLSSHVGDEFLLKNPGFQRINYVRDALVLGISWDLSEDWRTYAEVGYSPAPSGGAEPLEFQFGLEYSPSAVPQCGCRWQPFFAVNVHLREEFDMGGGLNVETGWQRRGDASQRLLRLGVQYYNGPSLQYSFFRQHEEFLGAGVWVDF
jgi:hypothetical protein